MIGDYVLHFPLTDFAIAPLVLAAFLEVARVVLNRSRWQRAIDILLATGFLGALLAVGSGWWLVVAEHHSHDAMLSMHHRFAYGTLAAAAVSIVARLLEPRSRVASLVRTLTLVLAAMLVSGAGYYGGKMAHGTGADHEDHTHEATRSPTEHNHRHGGA